MSKQLLLLLIVLLGLLVIISMINQTKMNQNLILSVTAIGLEPAIGETGAPRLTAELEFRNAGSTTLLVNFYDLPWIKSLEPKDQFRIERITPPVEKRKPIGESDLIRILPQQTHVYQLERWFDAVEVGELRAAKSIEIYHPLKMGAGESVITFCFRSSPSPDLDQYRRSAEEWWQGEVCSSPASFHL